ncbi:MAG: hypothetical protein IKI64_10990 [Clostridia bacterium]|nr:hypothetical protein [Clostridia bacterium]
MGELGKKNNKIFIGIDTSCYTSSAACVCVDGILADKRRLLSVRPGDRGLRQSEGVFQHVKNMTELMPQLLGGVDAAEVGGVGVSVCPSGRENSYMPVFLVGKLLAETLGATLDAPVLGFTHQQGHLRAALVGNEALIGRPFFALHLSGGTSELLFADEKLNVECIGGTSDINAGQLVDRIGVKLGLSFPAGKQLEQLALTAAERGVLLPSSVNGTAFSLSGAETKAAAAIDRGEDAARTARSCFDLIARTLAKTVENAMELHGAKACRDFLFAGGVASSGLLREMLAHRLEGSGARLHFSRPELSSDNAVGAALMCMDALAKGETGGDPE